LISQISTFNKEIRLPTLLIFTLFGSLTIFAKQDLFFFQCGFNPLFFNELLQWVKTTLDRNAKIVKEPLIFVEHHQVFDSINSINLINSIN